MTGVILNPDNGPGATARPVYRQLIDRLHVAGVHVLGYVRTGFGGRDAAAVENDIDHWRQWYGIADIFLDEAAATTSAVSTYSRFATLIHHSGGRVVLNPGVVPARQYFAFADGVVTFEDSASGYLQPPVGTPGWLRDEPQAKVWNIVIDTPGAQLDDVLHAVRAHHAGVIFVTDATVPNPYDQLPAYWAREVSAVARM